ncbi:MAG: 2,3-epoxybenzoyl-CoA dihydrolase [Acidimicrobiales bacterium]
MALSTDQPEGAAASHPALPPITFDRDPADYRHWRVTYEGPVATVHMEVDPEGGLRRDYELKSNSYDLSVDIELYDIVQRLRFEHPEVRVVVLTGGLEKLFCAGANIQMLAGATHHHKVNFCKFTNETRNSIEDASAHSGQVWLAALNGTAAGGGYELALACDEIVLIDDRSSTVSLPEVALLGVLPGTGGLTRLVDKRKVRRDRADQFCTRAEGVRGTQAVEWGLVDAVVPRSRWDEHLAARAAELAAASDRAGDGPGVELDPIDLVVEADGITGRHVTARIDRAAGAVHITVHGPVDPAPQSAEEAVELAEDWWALGACRELDAVILHLRFNEPALGTWVLHTMGDPAIVADHDAFLVAGPHGDGGAENGAHWLLREVRLYWARTLKRLDLSARTLLALLEPGSCFTGVLAELALAADQSIMLDGTFEGDERPAAAIQLTEASLGRYPMSNGLSRLQSRFWGHDDAWKAAAGSVGTALEATDAYDLGLVTAIPDDLDWDDEVRLFIEERASFSPDALTGLEANLRFVGPETMETKIFARLTAWQNWIFQRPNASGPDGALRRYGSGSRPTYDTNRI